jgi:uncharacterized protein (TIGR04255 family)
MGTQRVASNDLPEYDNPPVTEVVCGILLKTLKGLLLPHFGLFWERCKTDYPTCQEVAPLMPLIESFAGQTEALGQLSEVPLPRIWFVHREDKGIIQIQRDRFLHNWKKSKPTDDYPRYHTVIDLFKRHLESFEGFLKEHSLGTVDPLQYEMTYVNHIFQMEGWNEFSDLGKVFRDYQWDGKEKRFLPGTEHLDLRTTFELPGRKGRLHVSIREGKRRNDLKPLLLFELTVRGFPGDPSRMAMWEWFDVAREWIVLGFTDLTTAEIQKNVWRRTR